MEITGTGYRIKTGFALLVLEDGWLPSNSIITGRLLFLGRRSGPVERRRLDCLHSLRLPLNIFKQLLAFVI